MVACGFMEDTICESKPAARASTPSSLSSAKRGGAPLIVATVLVFFVFYLLVLVVFNLRGDPTRLLLVALYGDLTRLLLVALYLRRDANTAQKALGGDAPGA